MVGSFEGDLSSFVQQTTRRLRNREPYEASMTGYLVYLPQPVDWDHVPPCPFVSSEEFRKLPSRNAPRWHAVGL
jgi:hypothetical protein